MSIRIEIYNNKYQNQVIELISEIVHAEFSILLTKEQKLEMESDIIEFHDIFWIAINDKNIVGTIGLKIIKDFGVIRKFFVHPDFRGAHYGTAKKLLDILEMECIGRSVHKIYLGTRAIFKAAHKFYEKNHYIELYMIDLPIDFPIMKVDTKFYHKYIR